MECEDRTQTAYSEGRTSTHRKVFASPDGGERRPTEGSPGRKAVRLERERQFEFALCEIRGRERQFEVHSGKIGAAWCELCKIRGRERHLEVHSGKIGAAWCEICCSFISSQILLHLIAEMLCDAEWKGLRKVFDMFILVSVFFGPGLI